VVSVKIKRSSPCEAEEKVVEEARQRLRNAKQRLVDETGHAVRGLSVETPGRVLDRGNLRAAHEQVTCWEQALGGALHALEECRAKYPRLGDTREALAATKDVVGAISSGGVGKQRRGTQ
jgi:hypothetical protein